MAQHPVFHAPHPIRAARARSARGLHSGRHAAAIGLAGVLGLIAATAATAAEPPATRVGPPSSAASPAVGPSLTGGAGSLRLDFNTFSARFDLAMPAADDPAGAWRRPGWQLLGDYRFDALGGLRATGGLLGAGVGANLGAASSGLVWPAPTGPRSAFGALPADSPARGQLWARGIDSGVATYVGFGYSLGERPGGWGLSADLGLIGQRDPAEVRLGRSSTPGVDWLRELRLRPMLQVGASYAF